MSHPIVYRWGDGSLVEMPYVAYFGDGPNLKIVFSAGLSFTISLNPEKAAFALSPPLAILMRASGVPQQEVIERYPQIQAQIRGFLLDLGVVPNSAGVLLRGAAGDITTPFFVSEDLWSRRFELAKANRQGNIYFEAAPDYMQIGNIYRLRIWYDTHNMNWHIKWMSREVSVRKYTSDTFENAVGVVMRESNILPESERANWEEANVERGTFLIPTPEEVEVFRILDEPLPFFLPGEEAQKWIKERQA